MLGLAAVKDASGAVGPTESLGCTSSDGTGYVDTTRFKNSGTYAIVLDPSARGVGSATVKPTVVHDQQQTIVVNGALVNATVSQADAQSLLTFNGTASQKVTIDGTGATAKLVGCGNVALRAPDGATMDLRL